MVNLTHTAGLTLMVQAGVAEEVAVADEAAEVVEAVFSSQRMILVRQSGREQIGQGVSSRRTVSTVHGYHSLNLPKTSHEVESSGGRVVR